MVKTRRQFALQQFEHQVQPRQSPLGTWGQFRNAWANLLEMPLDIIFEILGHLPPQGLVALSRTNKMLRRTIDSRGMMAWKSARLAVGAPECAPGFSERQWAILLFGGTTCGICATGDAPKFEFSIRRRICSVCMSRNMVPDTNFADTFPSYDPLIMSMIPYTQESPRRSFFDTSEWKRLQVDIAKRRKGAQDNAAVYRAGRVGEVERAMRECEDWLSQSLRQEAKEKWDRRCYAIRDRLMTLGYEEQDIPFSLFNNPQFHEGDVITTIFWESIRPGLVKQVEAARRWRHFQEKNALHRRRTDLLQPLYDAYARSLPPQQWAYLPDIQDVALFSLFGDVVTADSSTNVTESSFMPAMRALPALIMAKNAVAKVRITSLLGPLSEEVDEPLDLATSVFECDSWCRHRRPSLFSNGERLALMSWEVIVTHASNISTSQFGLAKLKLSTAGSSTAVALVREAGLDPLRATIMEMDALDLRFVCSDCESSRAGWPAAPTVGYPWKPAIEHALASGHMGWQKMTQGDTIRIKQAETYNEDNERSWSCNHCVVYYKCWDTKPRVLQHLNDVYVLYSLA
ncbi:hypothetical protein BD779DRAFT_1568255 [Infundibulicybe gibba]|nr:hypothetical protein BD779DRAFT_1568255 [Infundibulicybe gibba]